jgi:hypothetical protein
MDTVAGTCSVSVGGPTPQRQKYRAMKKVLGISETGCLAAQLHFQAALRNLKMHSNSKLALQALESKLLEVKNPAGRRDSIAVQTSADPDQHNPADQRAGDGQP